MPYMYKYEIFITECNAQKHAWILPPFFIPQYRSRYWPHNPASFRQRVILARKGASFKAEYISQVHE